MRDHQWWDKPDRGWVRPLLGHAITAAGTLLAVLGGALGRGARRG